MNKKDVTISDIAKTVGVSVTTVSRVLNGSDLPVTSGLREKILQTAAFTGYIHHPQKRRTQNGCCESLGLAVPNLSNPYYTTLLDGVSAMAARYNCGLLLLNAQREAEREVLLLNSLIKRKIRGVIIVSIAGEFGHLSRYIESGGHIVSVEQNLPINCSRIDFNYRMAGALAAQHLYGLGHRRFAFISAPMNKYCRIELKRGYLDFLKKNGIGDDSIVVLEAECESESADSVYEFTNGRALAVKMLQRGSLPTGVFCNNDMTAFGAIRELERQGYKVPDGISVIGFDNIPFCQAANPPLTTIDQCTYQIGSYACEALMKRLTGELSANTSIVFEPALICRGSTGPAKL